MHLRTWVVLSHKTVEIQTVAAGEKRIEHLHVQVGGCHEEQVDNNEAKHILFDSHWCDGAGSLEATHLVEIVQQFFFFLPPFEKPGG